MKKKIILIVAGIATVVGTIIGVATYSSTNSLPFQEDFYEYHYQQCLYGCPISNKNKKRGLIDVLQKLWKRDR